MRIFLLRLLVQNGQYDMDLRETTAVGNPGAHPSVNTIDNHLTRLLLKERRP